MAAGANAPTCSGDLLARAIVLLTVAGMAALLAWAWPEALVNALTEVYWPLLHGAWMNLAQVSYPLFCLAAATLLGVYLRQPRPQHAAQALGLLALWWMLPKVFLLPHVLNVMSSLVMLALTVAVAHEAYQMAYRDELTGLLGRRALNERLQRLGRHYVLAMVDVDHFKRLNDRYGHDVGDHVLRMIAAHLRRVDGGKAYRYGGEEFTLVFPGHDLDACRASLEALRQAVERYRLHPRDRHTRPKDDESGRALRSGLAEQGIAVTVSIGVAVPDAHRRSPAEVIKAADKALYAAKGAGRNRISVHGQQHRGAVRVARRAAEWRG